jgi:hypothetical protein
MKCNPGGLIATLLKLGATNNSKNPGFLRKMPEKARNKHAKQKRCKKSPGKKPEKPENESSQKKTQIT